jgi:septal ring factor EnvC (AmiA/AmiB activator)
VCFKNLIVGRNFFYQYIQETDTEMEDLNTQIALLQQKLATTESALAMCRDENQQLRQQRYDKNKEVQEELAILNEQLDQQTEWFKEINSLVGADEDEPAVVSVEDYVREHQKLVNEVHEFVTSVSPADPP